jgi:hypothetical protein
MAAVAARNGDRLTAKPTSFLKLVLGTLQRQIFPVQRAGNNGGAGPAALLASSVTVVRAGRAHKTPMAPNYTYDP